MAIPANVSPRPCLSTRRRTSPRVAPRAVRIPISDALSNRVRHDAVNSNRTEQQRQRSEKADHLCGDPHQRVLFGDQVGVSLEALILVQRLDRVHARSSPCGNVGRQHCHNKDDQGHGKVEPRFAKLHVEEHGLKHFGQWNRQR
jgi:hypothetical protein